MWNFVNPNSVWDTIAKQNKYWSICPNHGTEEKFWEQQPDVSDWGIHKDTIFLEVGCGLGRMTRTIAPLVKEYHGLDRSSIMIQKAIVSNEEHINAKFYVGDGVSFGLFEDCSFDFILEWLVFIHCPKDAIKSYIKEAHRILKPGGVFRIRSLPKNDSYVNGFSKEEFDKVTSIFSEVIEREITNVYQLSLTK